jgi:hypothetical protein
MMGWRLVMAGLMTCAVLAARPVSAGDLGQEEGAPGVATSDDVSAFNGSTGSSDTWSTVGWGALTGLSNLLYVPAKLVYAGVGGLTGGLALGLTGGDMNTAQAIWEPSLRGDYFLTPGMIQGEESFSFAGAPAVSPSGFNGSMPDDEHAPPAPPPTAPPPSVLHRHGG